MPGIDPAEHRNRQLRPDAGDGQQLLKQPLLVRLGETEQRDLVLAHMGVDMQARLGALRRQRGKGRHADGGVVANAATLDDGAVRRLHQQPSAQESNHWE
jgi:hypothetical protein